MNSPFRKFKNQSSSQQSVSDKKRAFLKRKPIYFFVEMHSSFITAVRERQYLYFKSSGDVYNIHCIYKVTKRFCVILFFPRFCVGFFLSETKCLYFKGSSQRDMCWFFSDLYFYFTLLYFFLLDLERDKSISYIT